jgi:RND superfamily putative drug exporter
VASLLFRLGAFSAKRHWFVIGAWLLVFLGITLSSATLGQKYSSALEVPNTQSQEALNMLNERFPAATGSTVHVIYSSASKDISNEQTTFASAATKLSSVSGVTQVIDPFDSKSTTQISSDGSGAYLTVKLDENTPTSTRGGEQTAAAKEILTIGNSFASTDLTVAFTGIPDADAAPANSDLIGMGVALIVLVITFGSLLAAGMPIISAAIGVSISGSLLVVASHFAELSSTTPLLGSMLGLAVGIDYALFIVSRHRSNLANGMSPAQSVAVSTATAGTAVLAAGVTVIIALLGLFVVGIPFLGMMGMGAAIAVALAMSVALTLIPAILGVLGKRLIPKSTSKAFKREQSDAAPTMGIRWGKIVTARPLVTIVLVLAALVTLAWPATQLRLTIPGEGYDPVGSITRTGFDAMAADFGPGVNGPLVIVADVSKTDVTQIETVLDSLHDQFVNQKGIESVTPAGPNPGLDTAVLEIIPTTGPNSEKTVELVERLRGQADAFEKKNGFTYAVTGNTAVGIDISALLANAILPFGVVVIGLSMLLLMVAFRSIAVPLSATIGFVLSVASTFGVTVAIFLWGFGADLFGVTKVGPVVSFMPILVMAVLFGLAMDYEVFLVSRMRERFIATRDAHASVVAGFGASARVVTAAAIIMFSVFFSFVPGSSALLQPVALALAIGVAIDAFVVRMTLIPAVMSLLGKRAWALPHWLERRLPVVDIEGEKVQGRLATLRWQKDLNANVVIQSDQLLVTGAPFAPITIQVREGDILLIKSDTDEARLLLGAFTGRTDARGLLISCGRPLPFDGVHVRRETALVLSMPEVGEGSLEDLISSLLILNRVKRDADTVDTVLRDAIELANVAGVRFENTRLSRPLASVTNREAWLIDVAVALMQPVKLIAVDVRNAPNSVQAQFVNTVAAKADARCTILALMSEGADDSSLTEPAARDARGVTTLYPTVTAAELVTQRGVR